MNFEVFDTSAQLDDRIAELMAQGIAKYDYGFNGSVYTLKWSES